MRALHLSRVGVLVAVTVLGLVPDARAGFTVLPPHATVAGKTIGEHTADWWQWALGFSSPGDPFTDPTGAAAGLNQSGPVFFVAGTPGGSATRSFTVPADKFLLIPLLAAELSQLELGDFTLTEPQVRQQVNGLIDLVDEFHSTVDGVPVPDLFSHREESPAFAFSAAAGNPFGVPTGPSGIAVADGYWVMVAPIPAGETHVINFGGGVSEFGFSVDVTATITAVAVPEPASLGVLGGMGALSLCGHGLRRLRGNRGVEPATPGRA